MSYSHLTIIDRTKIGTYLESGLKPCQIASKLGVHKSTISRELRRCQNGYSADLSQEQYDNRSKQKGRKSCLTPKLKYDINHRPRKCLAYRTAYEALVDELE